MKTVAAFFMALFLIGCASVDPEAVRIRVADVLQIGQDVRPTVVVCNDAHDVGLHYQAIYGRYITMEGFYSRKTRTVYYVDGRLDVLVHELSHALLDGYFREDMPVWMHEYIANYVVLAF
jgi:hypothetical protein